MRQILRSSMTRQSSSNKIEGKMKENSVLRRTLYTRDWAYTLTLIITKFQNFFKDIYNVW